MEIILISFIALLFIPYLKEEELVNISTKNYKLALIGLISALLISMLNMNYFVKSWLTEQITISILVFFMIGPLIILKFRKNDIYSKFKEIEAALNETIIKLEDTPFKSKALFDICLAFQAEFMSRNWRVKIKTHKLMVDRSTFSIDVDMRERNFHNFTNLDQNKEPHKDLFIKGYLKVSHRIDYYFHIKKEMLINQMQPLIQLCFMI